jgi:hypothetical protein
VQIRSDLKWYDNTDHVCKRGYAKLWLLRQLRSLGADREELLDVYQKQVRSILEMADPVWEPALTKEECKQIERVQKTACYIIMGDDHTSYMNSLQELGCQTLKERRGEICLKFAKKALKHPKYKNWFSPSEAENNKCKPNTRAPEQEPTKFKPVPCRTDRYRDSPIPYLTNILNVNM